jgi:TolB-like protein/DNA-binding winged helix-turn-helix (wHTH) protein/tetratricopeptide (TPR) repeat protein
MRIAGAARSYEFEGFRLDGAKRQLIGAGGTPIPLSSRAFDVLLFMVERPGEMLEKQALLDAVWPKTVVEENSLTQCIFTLRRALGDTASEHRFIVTVPGRGYQFIAPVKRAVPDDAAPATSLEKPADSEPRRTPLRRWTIGGVMVAALVLAGVLLYTHREGSQLADQDFANRPAAGEASIQSIAVMPFKDLSPLGDMEYFCDGMTEEVTTSLSRVASLQIVGRRSAYAFKGKDVDARSIGEKLKVDSILEGSVRKSGDRIRITAELVRTRDGFSLWSQTFDRKLDDVLDVQSAVAQKVVGALTSMTGARGAKPKLVPATKNAEAYNAYLRGIYFYGSGTNLSNAQQAFLSATERDPEFALAHAWLGRTQAQLARAGIGDTEKERKRSDESLQRALELDPRLGDLWWVRAWPTNLDTMSLAMRANIFERALAHDRSDPQPMLNLALVYVLMGRRPEVLARVQEAYQIDPLWPNTLVVNAEVNYGFGDRTQVDRLLTELESVAPGDPRAANFRSFMAFSEGRALDWDRFKARAIAIAPLNLPQHCTLSREYGHLGLLDAALYHASKCHDLNPAGAASDYSVAHIQLFAGNIDAARQVAQHAVAESPNNFFSTLAQAEVQYFAGNCNVALDLIQLARPAFRQPAGSLDLVTNRYDVPILVWCLRQSGNGARFREVVQDFETTFSINPGQEDGLKARVAAAAGDRDALVKHLLTVDRTPSMDFTFVRHEPMIQPYLKDPEILRLLESIEARHAEWRRIIPKSSMRVPIPAAATQKTGN